jgi:hypothetical protein
MVNNDLQKAHSETFPNPLCVKPVCLKNTGFFSFFKKKRWLIEFRKPFVYVDKSGKRFESKIGFRADGGSIPRLLRFIITPFAPSMVEDFYRHDHRYETHDIPRKEADKELYEDSEGRISKALRKSIYRSVRMFGGKAWKEQGMGKYDK